jgi:hypothetical protein
VATAPRHLRSPFIANLNQFSIVFSPCLELELVSPIQERCPSSLD